MDVGGISTGIDVAGIVAQLMEIERMPLANIQFKKEVVSQKSTIYSDIKTRVRTLGSTANELTNDSAFQVFTAAYSKESIVSASVGATASSGNYNITVSKLAAAHTVGSDRQVDDDSVLNISGNIKINGKDVAIGVGDTLVDIKNSINGTADIGVEATIVDNVLKIKMSETGETEITFADDSVTGVLKTLGILGDGVLDAGKTVIDELDAIKNEFVTASNASITIDGQTISKTSNEVSDVISGVTLTLVKEDSVTLTVKRDNSAIVTKIQNLVNQYNSVVELIYSKTSEKKVSPPVTDADRYKGLASGDQFLESIRHELSSLMVNKVNGLDEDVDALAKIGITRTAFVTASNNQDLMVGKLNIDNAKLTEALDEDFENVKDMFVKNANTEDLENEDYGIAVRVKKYVDRLTNVDGGYFTTKSASFSNESKALENDITNFNRRMVIREAGLKSKYVKLDVAMAQSDTQSQWLTAQLSSL
jgi:flagellar hook-associated protein 2